MGMAGLAAASIGGNILAQMFAPDGQEIQSFDTPEGRARGIDPYGVMDEAHNGVKNYGNLLQEILGRDVTLPSSYVQSPPTITGGGLPMPIGVSGRDPALNDPKLLTKPGIQSSPFFTETGPGNINPENHGSITRAGSNQTPPTDAPNGRGTQTPPATSQTAANPFPVPQGVQRRPKGTDLLNPGSQGQGQVDDPQQAMAAIRLLMGG
jgi:hypothetical protein